MQYTASHHENHQRVKFRSSVPFRWYNDNDDHDDDDFYYFNKAQLF